MQPIGVWAQRPRLHLGLQVDELVSRPGVEIVRPGTAARDLTVIRYTGAPVPRSWEPEQGGTWQYKVEAVVRSMVPPGSGYSCSYPEGRLMTVTTCFPHPADRPPRNAAGDPYIFLRFQDDGSMRPLYSYARGNCICDASTGKLRQLSPVE